MKQKNFFCFFLFVLVFTSLPCLAKEMIRSQSTNQCVNEIEKHVTNDNMLIMQNCNLQDADMPEIVTFLQNHSDISYLDVRFNSIGDTGVSDLVKITPPSFLLLDKNPIGDLGAEVLAKANISILSLINTHITDQGVMALAKNSYLTFLDISQNKITDVGVAAFSQSKLEGLSAEQNQIGDNGAIALANSRNFDILLLDGNHISDNGAAALAKNTSLSQLSLGQNQINDAGASALAKNSTMWYLLLDYNNLTNTGAFALASNVGLYALHVAYNHIGPAGISALVNRKFGVLDTTGNNGSLAKLMVPKLSDKYRMRVLKRFICEKEKATFCRD